MTPDELRKRCTQAHDQLMTFDFPTTHEASEALYTRNMTILESLCREMLAAGLERADKLADRIRAESCTYGMRSACFELGSLCRQEAQRVKDGGA